MLKKSVHKEKKISLIKKIKRKLFFLVRLNHHPVIKVYNGYGNDKKIIVLGQVLKLSPYPRKTFRTNWIINVFSTLRLFMIIPFSHAKISIHWQGNVYFTKVEDDGFFRFEIFTESPSIRGWQKVSVKLEEEKYLSRQIEAEGEIYIPYPSQYAFISDIDDTFLISHSVKIRKKLYALFIKNAHSRKPFKGVVNHYNLLAQGGQVDGNNNPFFYVSGSEWNLYDLILEFSRSNDLPKGIFLLSAIKGITQFWKSGSNNLMTKFARIVRIIEAFPHLHFVLLGDDSQIDADIYTSVVKHFPGKIFAVYMRQVGKNRRKETETKIKEMECLSVNCCYFKHSAEAVIHSKMIGLVDK